MKDVNFPTIDKKNPYKLTEREEDMMNKLLQRLVKCEKIAETYEVNAEKRRYV